MTPVDTGAYARHVSARPRGKAYGPGPYVLGARLRPDVMPRWDAYPFLPVVADLPKLAVHESVVMLVGENGTGKSTLLVALAGALGFPPEGGPLPYAPQCRTRQIDASDLATMVEVDLGARKPRSAFFLRRKASSMSRGLSMRTTSRRSMAAATC